MEWKEFKNELPEVDRLILYGNNRWVEPTIYYQNHPKILQGKMHYKDITHWCYIDPPPSIEFESKWNNDETQQT